MICIGGVASIRKVGKATKLDLKNRMGKILLCRLDIIMWLILKCALKELECDCVSWIHLASGG
jgi:hypothetical protein